MKQTSIFSIALYVILFLLLNVCTACNKQTVITNIQNNSKDTSGNQKLTVDFSINNGVGHPYVFGEGGAPKDVATASNISSQGFTLKRTSCDIDWLLGDPRNITLADYKNDVNGIRTNPAKPWLSNSKELINYGSKGVKFIAIIGYVPTWLSFKQNSRNGIPKDWGVYEELVQKVYLKYKSYNCVKFMEIWNEPAGEFLDLTGSPYTNKLTAYKDIYYHTVKAIHAVDNSTTILLGGPTSGSPRADGSAWADSLLNDPRIGKDVNFFSYHYYGKAPLGPDSDSSIIASWKAVATKYGKPDMPIFITEWNSSYNKETIRLNDDSPEAISFIGKRLTDFYVNHLFGATIFTMGQRSQSSTSMDGIFEDGTFMPKVRTFYLMSKILSLGKGESALKQTNWTACKNGKNITNAGSAITIDNQKVVWMTNDTQETYMESVVIKGLTPSTQYTASVWEASPANTAQSERESKIFSTDQTGKGHFTLSIVGKSVTGFIIK